jgi:SAM-dependent methyltransferase
MKSPENLIMPQAFDYIAEDYDKNFTETSIGKAQRKLVWNHLEKVLNPDTIQKVLEINCGTGEDAIWLAQKNVQIWATDISEKMIEIAKQKALHLNNVSFQVADLQHINIDENQKFDLIFSNFGGLNCLSKTDLSAWLNHARNQLLAPKGKIILVIMPSFCLWESCFFLLKMQFSSMFRRLSKKPLNASLDGQSSIPIWYHSPRWIRQNLPLKTQLNQVMPIGFFIPPSYLNHFFKKRPLLLKYLEKLEQWAVKFPVLGSFSDHFLIEIQAK